MWYWPYCSRLESSWDCLSFWWRRSYLEMRAGWCMGLTVAFLSSRPTPRECCTQTPSNPKSWAIARYQHHQALARSYQEPVWSSLHPHGISSAIFLFEMVRSSLGRIASCWRPLDAAWPVHYACWTRRSNVMEWRFIWDTPIDSFELLLLKDRTCRGWGRICARVRMRLKCGW